jgi:hypothetical protein
MSPNWKMPLAQRREACCRSCGNVGISPVLGEISKGSWKEEVPSHARNHLHYATHGGTLRHGGFFNFDPKTRAYCAVTVPAASGDAPEATSQLVPLERDWSNWVGLKLASHVMDSEGEERASF